MGCKIYLDQTGKNSFALGTLTHGTDIFEYRRRYPKNDVNNFFTDYAMAVMIDQGCFAFDMTENSQSDKQVKYTDIETYKEQVQKENGFNINVNAG